MGEGTPPFYGCANLGKTKALNGLQQTLVLGLSGRERSELGWSLAGIAPWHRWGLSPPSGSPLYQLRKDHLIPAAPTETHLTEEPLAEPPGL